MKSADRLPRRNLLVALLFMISGSLGAVAQDLPPGGTSSWEIQELEVIVTFLIFDPKAPAAVLPKGLRFVSLRDVKAPEFEQHLKQHPEHADWAFSFVEFVRPKAWVLDGRTLTLPANRAIAVWFAPVKHSELSAELPRDRFDAVVAPSPDAVLVFGLWIPDRDYVAYMRARGHHADFGAVTLVKDSEGAIQGELQLANLNVKATATPHGDVRSEPDPFTQVFFEPGKTVENVVVLAGRDARERDCKAEWSKTGNHPLARGVFLGPTFLTIEGPLRGSAYRVGKAQ